MTITVSTPIQPYPRNQEVKCRKTLEHLKTSIERYENYKKYLDNEYSINLSNNDIELQKYSPCEKKKTVKNEPPKLVKHKIFRKNKLTLSQKDPSPLPTIDRKTPASSSGTEFKQNSSKSRISLTGNNVIHSKKTKSSILCTDNTRKHGEPLLKAFFRKNKLTLSEEDTSPLPIVDQKTPASSSGREFKQNSSKSRIGFTKNNVIHSKKKKSSILCTDNTRKHEEPLFKACKGEKRKKSKAVANSETEELSKYSSYSSGDTKHDTLNTNQAENHSSGDQDTELDVVYDKRHVPINISDLLIRQQDMNVEEIITEMRKLAKPCLSTETIYRGKSETTESQEETSIKVIFKEPYLKQETKGFDIPPTCDKQNLAQFLQKTDYSQSDINILLGDLLIFKTSTDERRSAFDKRLTSSVSHHKMDFQISDDEAENENLNLETESENAEMDLQEKKISEEVLEGVDEEKLSSVSGSSSLAETSFLKKTASRTKQLLPAKQLQGTLFKNMSKYFSTKIEGITTIKKNLTEDLEPHFLDVLTNAIEEIGIPENEKALKFFLSNADEEMGCLKIAEYYEQISKLKVSRLEKYPENTTSLEDLFVNKSKQDTDIFELLAPYLQKKGEIQEQVPKVRGKQKKKKKKRETMIEDGPFNILLRSGIPRDVWMGALKRAKKKIDVLLKTIDYNKNNDKSMESYHEHFFEYFKKKRKDIKQIRKERLTPAIIKSRSIDFSEAESTSSFSSGNYYPEKEVMSSLLYDYDEKTDFPVPQLEYNKIGKIEKLKREKLFERSGLGGGGGGVPNTPKLEKSWHEKARKKFYKRRARVVEDYLYSSGDEITGLQGAQKEKKKKLFTMLADKLKTGSTAQIWSDEEFIEEEIKTSKNDQLEEIKRKCKEVCLSYKMHRIFDLVDKENFIKPPFSEFFMVAVRKIGEALDIYSNNNMYHTKMVKKFAKQGVLICLGMFYTMQKEHVNIFSDICSPLIDGAIKKQKGDSKKVPLNLLLSNATIQKERHTKWLRRYFGLESALKTEEKMPLYFGPSDESWVRYGPLKKKKN